MSRLLALAIRIGGAGAARLQVVNRPAGTESETRR